MLRNLDGPFGRRLLGGHVSIVYATGRSARLDGAFRASRGVVARAFGAREGVSPLASFPRNQTTPALRNRTSPGAASGPRVAAEGRARSASCR